MTIPAHLARLQHLTGRLTPSRARPPTSLPVSSAPSPSHLRDHPDLTIRGNRLTARGRDALEDASDAFIRRIRNLETELAGQPSRAGVRGGAARVQARDRIPLESPRQLGARVGNRDGAGGELRAFRRTSNGLHVWFDLFQPIRLVSVFFAGSAAPVLRVPIWGTITGRQSYRIEAGSAWIASNVIARVAALRATTPGSRSRAGRSISRRSPPRPGTASSSRRRLPPSLHLDLDQTVAPHIAQAAGIDAAEAAVQLPRALDLELQLLASRVARRGRLVHGVRLPGRLRAVRPAADLAPAHQPDPGALFAADHAHERAGSLRDRLTRSRRSARWKAARRSIPRRRDGCCRPRRSTRWRSAPRRVSAPSA